MCEQRLKRCSTTFLWLQFYCKFLLTLKVCGRNIKKIILTANKLIIENSGIISHK